MSLELLEKLSKPAHTKMLLIVMDGLGDLPGPGGLTPLEAAHTPNLDQLVDEGVCGLSTPVLPGISPGSGPGHLGLFGYDPLVFEVGRGVEEALGIDFPLGMEDLAARGNFCTIDPETGHIVDRRAGRILSEFSRPLVERLREIRLPGVETYVELVKGYRFVLVLRGEGLSEGLTDSDPQRTGVPPQPILALRPGANHTAELLNQWLIDARRLLAGESSANCVNLRGIAKRPEMPALPGICKMRAAAVARYPTYRGLARLVGMDVLESGTTLQDGVATLEQHWAEYDYFFLHEKRTDSTGEDGDFEGKRQAIEDVDRTLPDIMRLHPDVVVVTGDHSTPWLLKAHSWHELPLLLWGPSLRRDAVTTFGERPCMSGGLGHIRHVDVLLLMMAHAGRLIRFGA